MTNKLVPAAIYLQFYGDHDASDFDGDSEGVTWCKDRINDSDVCYVLEARLERRVKELENRADSLSQKALGRLNVVQVENERYLSAIKAFCEATKWGHPDWKKQDYIAALFEIAGGHDED